MNAANFLNELLFVHKPVGPTELALTGVLAKLAYKAELLSSGDQGITFESTLKSIGMARTLLYQSQKVRRSEEDREAKEKAHFSKPQPKPFADEPDVAFLPVQGYDDRLEFRRDPISGKIIGPFVRGADVKADEVRKAILMGVKFSTLLAKYPGLQKADIAPSIEFSSDHHEPIHLDVKV